LQEYKNTLNFLFGLQKFGMKFGLENIKHLLDFLENPETNYPTVHIAGTNGKGSTAAMIASILTASGYKTGLYTSPHLIDFTERIRIDGKPISSKEVVIYGKKLKSQIQKSKATFFEATTAIAFQYFSDKNVDVALIETGLGGRLDATNVIKPELSIITTIGMDHSEQLGNTIQSIASEKAGIIKSRTPCITSVKNASALKIIKQ
jgi:dihydrofolate synthase/folylpolyglutamate synthase